MREFRTRNYEPEVTAMERVAKAMLAFQSSLTPVNESVHRLGMRFTAHSLMLRRLRHGGMGHDAHYYPDEWMSTVCAGLICSLTMCPSYRWDLQCHHSCHDREVPRG